MSLLLDVALFLRKNARPFNLNSSQISILYTLAARIGRKKITWVSQKILCEDTNLSERALRDNIHMLDILGLIITKKNPQHKSFNVYSLSDLIVDYVENKVDIADGNTPPEDIPDTDSDDSTPATSAGHIGNFCRSCQKHSIYKKQNKNKTKNTCASSDARQKHDDDFDHFWNIYPKKTNKKGAKKSWNKIKPEIVPLIFEKLKLQIESDPQYNGGQYTPMAQTYLNNERWNDELPKNLGENKNGSYQSQSTQKPNYRAIREKLKRDCIEARTTTSTYSGLD